MTAVDHRRDGPREPMVVYYADQRPASDHTSVESLFHHHLNHHLPVTVVYHDREVAAASRFEERKIVIPYRARADLPGQIAPLLDLGRVGWIIVRNIQPVFRGVLRQRARWGYKALFHYSFPHLLRRWVEARETGTARTRKYLEYRLRRYFLDRMIRRGDGFLGISERMPALLALPDGLPAFPVHSGADFRLIPAPAAASVPPVAAPAVTRFGYVGTVDPLRRVDVILRAFDALERGDWTLTFVTAQGREVAGLIRATMSRHAGRVTVQPPMPRAALYRAMADWDVGLCFIPPTELYAVSSPIKLMEYHACGLPVVMSELPECRNLFAGAGCGWFAGFSAEALRETLERALETPPETRRRMGQAGRAIVQERRNYQIMAGELARFLRTLGD